MSTKCTLTVQRFAEPVAFKCPVCSKKIQTGNWVIQIELNEDFYFLKNEGLTCCGHELATLCLFQNLEDAKFVQAVIENEIESTENNDHDLSAMQATEAAETFGLHLPEYVH